MKIDFDHYQGAEIADLEKQNLNEERELQVIKALNPSLIKEGNQWCFILGEMPINFLAGFGDTPAKAMTDFVNNFYNETIKIPPKKEVK